MCLRRWCRSCATPWRAASSSRSRRDVCRAASHLATATKAAAWSWPAREPGSSVTCRARKPGSFRWWPSAGPRGSRRPPRSSRWLLPERRGRQGGLVPPDTAAADEGIDPHPEAAAPQKQQHERRRQDDPELEPITDKRAIVERLDPVAAPIRHLHDTAGARVHLHFIVVLQRRFRDAAVRPYVEALDVLPALNGHVRMLVLLDGSQNIAELDDRRLRRSPMLHGLDPGPVLLHLQQQTAADQEEKRQGNDARAPVMEFSIQDIPGHEDTGILGRTVSYYHRP